MDGGVLMIVNNIVCNSMRMRLKGCPRSANQRALVARRQAEQSQLEVAFLRVLNDFLHKQVRKLTARLETALMGSMA